MELVLATNNAGKLQEIRSMLPHFTILALKDIGFTASIPEPYDTFRENAWTKAATIHQYCNKPVMADDSGICVDALGGAPGVFSARYAGEGATDEQNVAKLLHELKDATDRSAHYTAVICLITGMGEPVYFEGHCYGSIAARPSGNGGFGYDPVFIPEGHEASFGVLPQEVKNGLSHRGAAVRQMVQYLQELS